MTDTIENRIGAFIVENFLFGDTSYKLADNASLIENDIIDSTGVLELVAYIEDNFEIEMADTDIVPANLDSLERISAFIKTKAPQLAVA